MFIIVSDVQYILLYTKTYQPLHFDILKIFSGEAWSVLSVLWCYSFPTPAQTPCCSSDVSYILYTRLIDGTYYGMVMSVYPSVRLRPSVRVSVRQFSTLFSNMLWHIELKFCIWLCFTVLQINYECRQFASIFVGVMPLLELRILKIHSFPHFSLKCFWHIELKFYYCTTDQVRLSIICVNSYGSYAPFGT